MTARSDPDWLPEVRQDGFNHRAKDNLHLARLASYIASSALLINAAAVVPSFGNIEIPILTLILRLMLRLPTLTSHGA